MDEKVLVVVFRIFRMGVILLIVLFIATPFGLMAYEWVMRNSKMASLPFFIVIITILLAPIVIVAIKKKQN